MTALPSTCHKPSTAKRMAAAIKRLFTGKRKTKQGYQLSETARMELALAIAEQYVLVSQDNPDDKTVCGTQAAESDTVQTLCSPTTTCMSDKSSNRESSLFSRMVRRPRTASYESTVCGLWDQDYYYDHSFMVAASREQPLCC